LRAGSLVLSVARDKPRSWVRKYVSGLVTGLERKNGRTLAEWAGEVSPPQWLVTVNAPSLVVELEVHEA
jgi:hypothetical protein